MNWIWNARCWYFVLLLAAPVMAQSVELDDFPVRGVTGHVGLPLVSADGSRVVFLADDDGDEVADLLSAPSDGGSTTTLATDLSSYSYVELGGAGNRAVFASGDLYSVPIDGDQEPLKLNAPLPKGWGIMSSHISSDGTRVVYHVGYYYDAPNSRGAFLRLHSAHVSGEAPPVELSLSLSPATNLLPWIALSPDGSHVVFATSGYPQRMFVVPTDGSELARELPATTAGYGYRGGFLFFLFHHDGNRVFYVADPDEVGRFELFVIPIDGSEPPRRLNGSLVPGGHVGRSFSGSWPDGYPLFFASSLLPSRSPSKAGPCARSFRSPWRTSSRESSTPSSATTTTSSSP